MEAKTSRKAPRISGVQTTIPITQVVAVIHLGEGDRNPITAAFLAAGEYIADAAGGSRDVNLEFSYEGLEFSATYTAPPTRDPERMD